MDLLPQSKLPLESVSNPPVHDRKVWEAPRSIAHPDLFDVAKSQECRKATVCEENLVYSFYVQKSRRSIFLYPDKDMNKEHLSIDL